MLVVLTSYGFAASGWLGGGFAAVVGGGGWDGGLPIGTTWGWGRTAGAIGARGVGGATVLVAGWWDRRFCACDKAESVGRDEVTERP